MKKILVVYYSLTGNTKLIAETISKSLNADILPLKPIKELKPEGGMKFVWGGYQSYMKKKPKLEAYDINPEDYDLIILGTPVWAWRYSPPMRTFLSNHNIKGKKVAIWMCYQGDGIKALRRFKLALNKMEIIGDVGFKEPLKIETEDSKEKAIKWAKDLIDK
jgi:flavodoxin